MSDTIRVRHDAQAKLTLTGEYGPARNRQVIQERIVDVRSIDGAITVMSITFNAECMSGGTRWRDMDGVPFHCPKYSWELTDPDNQILKSDELCTCDECVPDEREVWERSWEDA